MTKRIEAQPRQKISPDALPIQKRYRREKMLVRGSSFKDVSLQKPAEPGDLTLDKITLVSFKKAESKDPGFTKGVPDDSCPIPACGKPQPSSPGIPSCSECPTPPLPC